MTRQLEERASVLAILREREGAPKEAELLRELVAALRAARGGEQLPAPAPAVHTVQRSVMLNSITIVEVHASSTEPCGGDAGHGARTSFRITDHASTCWQVEVEDADGTVHSFEPRSLWVQVQGDDEQGQLLAALGFVTDVMLEAGVMPTDMDDPVWGEA